MRPTLALAGGGSGILPPLMGTTSSKLALISVAGALACSGGGTTTKPTPPTPTPGPSGGSAVVTPTPPDPTPAGPPPLQYLPPTIPNRSPELFHPGWTAVGVGQTISFSTAAIDQDLDDVQVEVVAMPPSARFDAITQTITWTPTKADGKQGRFEIRARELDKDEAAVTNATWTIAVGKKKVATPVAPWGGDTAETLFTIREPARVAATAAAYPFDELLAWSATSMRATLAPDAAAKLPPVDKAALFKNFLQQLAQTHGNPRLDPDAAGFDAATFGDPKDWRLVVVRPRIDKKVHELRLVYQAVKAAEPVFAMFRVRPVHDVLPLPPEARTENNQVFAGLFWQHLLTADGALDPRWKKNAKAHGAAVAAFVTGVLSHKGTAHWAESSFIALPTEARLGGGSKRDADGGYVSGDGWAWSVQKPMVGKDGASQAFVNIGIPGFWTMAVPSPDQSTWAPKCAPPFDAADTTHVAGYEALCRKALGFVDLPDLASGKPAPSKIDAINRFRDHKLGPARRFLPLEDGRRDHGEENGMTCAQCHMRDFGVRDYADASTADPKLGAPKVGNRPLPTLNFQIIPSNRWEAYTLDFMADQECKAQAHLTAALGKPAKLTCTLSDPDGPRVTAPR